MATPVRAHITGTVWKITASPGDAVEDETVLMIFESMKMEMPLEAGCTGKVVQIHVKEGQPVNEGDVVAMIE